MTQNELPATGDRKQIAGVFPDSQYQALSIPVYQGKDETENIEWFNQLSQTVAFKEVFFPDDQRRKNYQDLRQRFTLQASSRLTRRVHLHQTWRHLEGKAFSIKTLPLTISWSPAENDQYTSSPVSSVVVFASTLLRCSPSSCSLSSGWSPFDGSSPECRVSVGAERPQCVAAVSASGPSHQPPVAVFPCGGGLVQRCLWEQTDSGNRLGFLR